MIVIGNFFFKYRNLVFPILVIPIFLPSPELFRESIFGLSYFWIPIIGGGIIAGIGQTIRAVTIALKYIVRGGKNKEVYADDLVIEGIFKHCRNPLYVGNVLMLVGVGIMSNSLYFMIFVAPVFIFIYQAIVLAEEHYLAGKFGLAYTAYTQSVNRWIPNFTGLKHTLTSMNFNWKRYLLSGEINTVYLLLIAIYLVLLTHYNFLHQLAFDKKIQLSGIVIGSISLVYLVLKIMKKQERSRRTKALA